MLRKKCSCWVAFVKLSTEQLNVAATGSSLQARGTREREKQNTSGRCYCNPHQCRVEHARTHVTPYTYELYRRAIILPSFFFCWNISIQFHDRVKEEFPQQTLTNTEICFFNQQKLWIIVENMAFVRRLMTNSPLTSKTVLQWATMMANRHLQLQKLENGPQFSNFG